jgi:DNA-binding NarL/FixJ family response regulator
MWPNLEASPKLKRGTRAVLIDLHPLGLDIVERSLDGLGAEVVGKFTSPSRGLAAVDETSPELLVIDIETRRSEGEIDGLACLRSAVEHTPGLKAIVFSSGQSDDVIAEAFDAGAAAYVVKTVQPDDFVSAIRQVFTQSMDFAVTPARSPSPKPALQPAKAHDLTNREVEILQLVAEGLKNTQVAQRLVVTEQTVKFHLSNIYRKLGLSNRTEASRWAQLHGLLQHDRDGRLAS